MHEQSRILRREVDRVELAEELPRQRVVRVRVKRLADDGDRPLAGRIDHHQVARMRLGAPCDVQPSPGLGDRPLDERARIVVPNRREQVQLGVTARQLEERAATRKSLAYFAQLADLQLADDESPARWGRLDNPAVAGSLRPQEAYAPHGWSR